MAKVLSFASWNVKHFSGKKERVEKVVHLLNSKLSGPFINVVGWAMEPTKAK